MCETTSLRVLTDFVSDAILFKLIEPAKVVAWVDRLIGETETPPTWMLELSLVNQSDLHAVRDVLRHVPGEPNLGESFRLVSALVLREWQSGRLTIGQVRGIGWGLYLRDPEQVFSRRWCMQVDGHGDLLDLGYITEAQMRALIDSELAIFESDLSRLPDCP